MNAIASMLCENMEKILLQYVYILLGFRSKITFVTILELLCCVFFFPFSYNLYASKALYVCLFYSNNI